MVGVIGLGLGKEIRKGGDLGGRRLPRGAELEAELYAGGVLGAFGKKTLGHGLGGVGEDSVIQGGQGSERGVGNISLYTCDIAVGAIKRNEIRVR